MTFFSILRMDCRPPGIQGKTTTVTHFWVTVGNLFKTEFHFAHCGFFIKYTYQEIILGKSNEEKSTSIVLENLN